MFGFNRNVLEGLIPAWGIDEGYLLHSAELLVTPLLLGGIFITPILAGITERLSFNKRALLYSTIVLCGFGILHFHRHPSHLVFHMGLLDNPLLYVLGGAIYVFHALYLCILSERFKGEELTAACASATYVGQAAGALTTLVTGFSMSHYGHDYLGLCMLLLNGLFVVFFLYQIKRKRA
jgi:predicted MFS family arabinose efflux permease